MTPEDFLPPSPEGLTGAMAGPAETMWRVMQAYLEVGFTRAEAFELTLVLQKAGAAQNMHP